MKVPFAYQDIHTCDAAVLACIDFRFWKETMKFVEDSPPAGGLGIKSYDFPKLPGAAKAVNDCLSEVDVAMKCIGVPCDLHHVGKVVIVNHADCGAYGGSKEFKGDIEAEQKFHEGELRRAKEKILKYYPDKEIILIYAKLVDGGENIEFVEINRG